MKKNSVTEYYLTLRDGVRLYTYVQMPEPAGKYPVIIVRSPYSTEKPRFEELEKAENHGYVTVTQHCRGTGCSEGICQAYINEREDGLELLEWIRKQPFYNGELFLCGGSYLSSVHFSYLNTDPPDVKAAFLAVQDSERYNICFRNGFFKPGLHGSWVLGMHRRNQPIERNATINTFRTRPLKGVTETIFNEYIPYIEESFSHPDPQDPYWDTPEAGSEYKDVCNRCSVPILLATSMYDIYTDGVFDMWKKLSPERKKDCALVVTPYTHAYNPLKENIPEDMLEFRNGLLREYAPDLEYAWFDHFRLGTPLPFIQRGCTTYYRLWDNSWHTVPELTNAPREQLYHLTPERALSASPAEGKITYTYNPCDPAPFEGGVCNNFGGMLPQAAPNSRYDIISFLSDPLEKELVCEGRIELDLACSSSAEDTCFYVRLSFERNGKTLSLRDDIDSLCRKEKEYTPGEERLLHYTFAPHAFKLLPGDRLRLDVSSSCVPYFQVHSNIKGPQEEQTVSVSCRNTILTGRSVLKLPILEA